ncbi:class II fructose-bisphosphate aldolase [Abyssisolibacter fermentans]|uniref:class II fructose-bisphosphate aldolase n=1 Tax=Abyssisolibacter fermentans TaxID=1766203 RepID=UPI000831DFD8|nr:class II fructose-bisphosphate aldolase [Abyssisolibacter fermentans]
MPVVNYQQYCDMLDNARKNKFAYVAANVTSLTTANAVLKAFAEMKTDGIIQVSTGGAQFASGLGKEDMALGAISLAQHIHLLAEKYDIYVALHTDHCPKNKLDDFLIPLLEETEKRRAKGLPNLFNSHMFDGGELPLDENLKLSKELLERCAKNEIILEIEAGVVGGEEDGVNNEDAPAEKLYTTPEDMLSVARELSSVPDSRFLLAATFGNVHGVYKPGNVKLKPSILKDGQEAIVSEFGEGSQLDLVFHGGSGSTIEDIHETLEYGVIKMNVDTDLQYAFSRPIADHFFKNYDGILKVDSEVGNKKVYDPRSYLRKGEAGMKEHVKNVIRTLRSENTTLFNK